VSAGEKEHQRQGACVDAHCLAVHDRGKGEERERDKGLGLGLGGC
jgi:hypothetical protein